MIDRHHLLECILWPNGNGTFRKIINRAKRLEELGIYDDLKMTIPIDHNLHQIMHREFEKGTEYERDLSGENNPMYGKRHTDDAIRKMCENRPRLYGENNPMYGRGYLFEGDRGPNWKGDDATPSGLYNRAKKLYKAGKITEEEFQPYRDLWAEDQRRRKKALLSK